MKTITRALMLLGLMAAAPAIAQPVPDAPATLAGQLASGLSLALSEIVTLKADATRSAHEGDSLRAEAASLRQQVAELMARADEAEKKCQGTKP